MERSTIASASAAASCILRGCLFKTEAKGLREGGSLPEAGGAGADRCKMAGHRPPLSRALTSPIRLETLQGELAALKASLRAGERTGPGQIATGLGHDAYTHTAAHGRAVSLVPPGAKQQQCMLVSVVQRTLLKACERCTQLRARRISAFLVRALSERTADCRQMLLRQAKCPRSSKDKPHKPWTEHSAVCRLRLARSS